MIRNPFARSRKSQVDQAFDAFEGVRADAAEYAAAILEPAEACATPVLSLDEAPRHPHNAARGSFVEIGGKLQPAPAPRFSGTPASVPEPPSEPGADTERTLSSWGLGAAEIARLAGVRD